MLTSALATCSRSAGSVAAPKRATTLVVHRELVLGALQRPEREALVDQRSGDLLAQRWFGRGAEARDDVVVHRDRVLGALQLPEHDTEVETGDRRDLINRRSVRAVQGPRRVIQALVVVRREPDREGLRVRDAIDRGNPRGVGRWTGARPVAHESHDVVKRLVAAGAMQQRDRAGDGAKCPRKRDVKRIVGGGGARWQIVRPELSQCGVRDRIGSSAPGPIDGGGDDSDTVRARGVTGCVTSRRKLALQLRGRHEVCRQTMALERRELLSRDSCAQCAELACSCRRHRDFARVLQNLCRDGRQAVRGQPSDALAALAAIGRGHDPAAYSAVPFAQRRQRYAVVEKRLKIIEPQDSQCRMRWTVGGRQDRAQRVAVNGRNELKALRLRAVHHGFEQRARLSNFRWSDYDDEPAATVVKGGRDSRAKVIIDVACDVLRNLAAGQNVLRRGINTDRRRIDLLGSSDQRPAPEFCALAFGLGVGEFCAGLARLNVEQERRDQPGHGETRADHRDGPGDQLREPGARERREDCRERRRAPGTRFKILLSVSAVGDPLKLTAHVMQQALWSYPTPRPTRIAAQQCEITATVRAPVALVHDRPFPVRHPAAARRSLRSRRA